jgi:hypothetical protein
VTPLARIRRRLREATAASAEPQLLREDDDETTDVEEARTTTEADFTDDERKKLAKNGEAMPDGGYPIREGNRQDLKDAIDSYGRGDDKPAVKAWITKRAKALDANDLLPDDWSGSTKDTKESTDEPEEECDTPMREARRDVHEHTPLREAAKKADAYEVVIIEEGLGNRADRNFYTKDYLRKLAESGTLEGLKAYSDHPSKTEERDLPERSVRRIAGYYRNVKYRESAGSGQVVGEFVPVTGDTGQEVRDLIETALRQAKDTPGAPPLIGISVDGAGGGDWGQHPELGRVFYVREPADMASADLVTTPGAGGHFTRRLTESLRRLDPQPRPGAHPTRSEEDHMKPATLQEKLKAAATRLREAAKTLREAEDETKVGAAIGDLTAATSELDELATTEIEVSVREVEKTVEVEVPVNDTEAGRKLRESETQLREAQTNVATLSMTTAQNNVSVEPRYLPQQLPVTTDVTINQGDLVFWDGTNFTLQPLTANTDVANKFLGMADSSTPALIYGGDPRPRRSRVLGKGCVYVYATNGETYNHFDAVTIGADSQTVTKSGATSGNRVGFVIIDPPASPAPPGDAGAGDRSSAPTGVRIRIQLEPKHPLAIAL